jgi:hypothetical protein
MQTRREFFRRVGQVALGIAALPLGVVAQGRSVDSTQGDGWALGYERTTWGDRLWRLYRYKEEDEPRFQMLSGTVTYYPDQKCQISGFTHHSKAKFLEGLRRRPGMQHWLG